MRVGFLVKPATFNEPLAEPLFHKDLFKFGSQHYKYKHCTDILQCNRSFCRKTKVETQFNIVIPYLKYHKIVISIKQIVSTIKAASKTSTTGIQNLCLKNLVANRYIVSIQIICIIQLTGNLCTYTSEKNCKNTNLLSLQYKIHHRVFNCNQRLSKLHRM